MASRGRQTFNKRQKEQQRKEKQQEKLVRRQQKKDNPDSSGEASDFAIIGEDGQLIDLPAGVDPNTLIENPNRLQRPENSIETSVKSSKLAE